MEWNSECTQLQLTHVTGAARTTECISRAGISVCLSVNLSSGKF